MPNPTDYDLLVSINKKLDSVLANQATPPNVSIDFTPVLTPLAALQTTADAILADEEPSVTPPPVAPATA